MGAGIADGRSGEFARQLTDLDSAAGSEARRRTGSGNQGLPAVLGDSEHVDVGDRRGLLRHEGRQGSAIGERKSRRQVVDRDHLLGSPRIGNIETNRVGRQGDAALLDSLARGEGPLEDRRILRSHPRAQVIAAGRQGDDVLLPGTAVEGRENHDGRGRDGARPSVVENGTAGSESLGERRGAATVELGRRPDGRLGARDQSRRIKRVIHTFNRRRNCRGTGLGPRSLRLRRNRLRRGP